MLALRGKGLSSQPFWVISHSVLSDSSCCNQRQGNRCPCKKGSGLPGQGKKRDFIKYRHRVQLTDDEDRTLQVGRTH